jgi:dihydroorotate dehydrogenase (fumarate)
MGMELKNPLIAGASGMTSHEKALKKIEEAGAGAIVIASLFEEQIQLERYKLEEDLQKFDNLYAEMTDIFPNLEHAGPQEHLMWVKKAKQSAGIPVIASLNAVNRETWVEYASLLEETGVDGLELNFYWSPTDFNRKGSDIESEQIEILKEVKKEVSIPISVKLSTFYSNPLNFIKKLDREGVDGFVLFNRFFQPDVDVEEERDISPFNFSSENDNRLPLRFAGLLYDNIRGDVCSSTGVMFAKDVIKMLLAGARCVQMVSTLYKNKISHIKTVAEAVQKWMEEKGYASIDSFRGKMSKKNSGNPWMYTRAQYVKLLSHPEKIVENISTS